MEGGGGSLLISSTAVVPGPMGGSAWRGRASFHPRQRRAPKAPYRRLTEGPGQMGPGNKCRDDSLWAAGMSRSWSKKLGRASCRERVCQYVLIQVVAVSIKKKNEQSQKVEGAGL